jgi:hypothetical protein
MIPGFLLGLMVQLTILPYFSRVFLSLSSVVSALRPPRKAMKFYFEAKDLKTKDLGGWTSRLVLKFFNAASPASMLV